MSMAVSIVGRKLSKNPVPRGLLFLPVLLLLAGQAWGQPLVCAEPVELAVASIRAAAPAGVAFETRAGAEARVIISAFNAEPPESDVEADQVTIGVSPELPRAVIVFGLRGCLVGRGWIGAPWARTLLGRGA